MIVFKVHEIIPLNTKFEFEWVTLLTSVGCQKRLHAQNSAGQRVASLWFSSTRRNCPAVTTEPEVQENQVFEEKNFSKPGNSLYLCKNINPLIFLAFGNDQCRIWENLNLVHITVQAPDCQVHETLPGDLSVTRNVTGQEQQHQTHVAELFSGRESCEFKDMHW